MIKNFAENCSKLRTSPSQERLRLYWGQKVVQHHINKEMHKTSVVFPLFCPTPVDECCYGYSSTAQNKRKVLQKSTKTFSVLCLWLYYCIFVYVYIFSDLTSYSWAMFIHGLL
jgi:hypothetical protein